MNIELTDSAVKQISTLLDSEDDAKALRVGIVGGGCSGFNYTFSFAEKIEEGDYIHTENGGRSDIAVVVIDPMSAMYLDGVTIDYKVDLSGSMFVIDNPSAKTTCGCGTSFSI